jgi:hypothetical protein
LRYELTGFALQHMLPAVKGRGWVPPGGLDEDLDPAKGGAPLMKTGASFDGIGEQDQIYLAWIAGLDNARRMVAACPATANAEACARGLDRAAEQAAKEAEQSQLKRLVKLGLGRQPNEQLKKGILDVLRSVAAPAFTKYVARYAERAFLLRALRIHAALAGRAATGRCPADLKQLIFADAAGLGRDPASGRPLRLAASDDGFVVRPSKGVREEYDALSYAMRCPRR